MAERINTKGRSGPAAVAVLVTSLGVTAMWAAWGCSSGPVADAPTLLSSRCSTCHSPNRGQTTNKTREEWNQTITRMQGKGAKVNNAEKAVLVDYLSKITAPR